MCFIKRINLTHVIVTMIPASVRDVKLLTYTRICDSKVDTFPAKKWSKLKEHNIMSDAYYIQEENVESRPENAKSVAILPIYVYDCSLSMLIDTLIDKLDSPRTQEIFQDHTYKFNSHLREEFVDLKAAGDIKSSSPEIKSEGSDNLQNGTFSFTLHEVDFLHF